MSAESSSAVKQWSEFGLDGRLLKAISKSGWAAPTLVQSQAIPLALEGKDILAKARTGSGKTGAFAVPVIQRILSEKEVCIFFCDSLHADFSSLLDRQSWEFER